MNINWNAKKYTEDLSFVHLYGNNVLELIDAKENSMVLDLGCGNGALTKELQNRGYQVIGMDASKEQLEIARSNYPDIEFISGDTTDFLLTKPVDVVFSIAVFHWIERKNKWI